MGLTDEKGLAYADSLGRAMQLTNIARDIKEDAERGRVYIPEDWCRELGLTHEDILYKHRWDLVAKLAEKLVRRSEDLYKQGEKGLIYLNFRSAVAVAAARFIYAEIGREVLRRGEHAWETRTWIPMRRKIWLACRGFLLVSKSLPQRLLRRAPFIRIQQVRHFE